MDGRMDQFSFESDIKDVKKVRLEKDNRKILTEIPFNSTVNSDQILMTSICVLYAIKGLINLNWNCIF